MGIHAIDGLPVIDAKKPLKLTINKNDVAKTDRKESADCAVARACRRETHAIEARVHLGRVYLKTSAGSWTRYLTPRPLRSEIIAFDRGGQFEPGEFMLGAPTPTKTLGKRRGGTKKAKRTGKQRQKPTVVHNVRTGPA